MRGTEGELTRELRMVLDNAIQIRLNSTKGEPDAQARALMAYPLLGLEREAFGLAEMLGAHQNFCGNTATTPPPIPC